MTAADSARGADRRLILLTLAVWTVLTVWKGWMAAHQNLLWEEAHFVILGRHADIGYSDVPAGWPLFARALELVFGPSPLALRLASLAISQAFPLAVYFLARSVAPRREAIWAALVSIVLPPLGAPGPLFYPEGALQLLLALMLGAAARAMAGGRMAWWIATGVFGALGLFIHHRFVLAGAGVVVFALFSREGRRLWTTPGFWIAGLIAFAGVLPGLAYNIREGWPTVAYQIVNRPGGGGPKLKYLVSLIETQIGLATPAFFIGLVAAAWIALRRGMRGEAAAALYFWTGLVTFATYAAASPFSQAIMPHWPFLAYVAWLPFLPRAFIAFVDAARRPAGRFSRQALIATGPLVALLIALAGTVFIAGWSRPQIIPDRWRGYLLGENENWTLLEPSIARAEAAARAAYGGEPAIAASGHIQALRLEFPGKPGRRVYDLVDPYDVFTRFEVLRAQWGLDAAGLRKQHAGQGAVLMLLEPTYLYNTPVEAEFLRRLCGEFTDIRRIETAVLPPGRTAVGVYIGRVKPRPEPPAPGADCALYPRLYIGQPVRAANMDAGEGFHGHGAAGDPAGIASVEMFLDGVSIGPARIALDTPGARAPDVLAFDPAYPKVQYDYDLPPAKMTPGLHRLQVRAVRKDGVAISLEPRVIYVP